MAIKSNNEKGNKYHDESTGQFTSAGSSSQKDSDLVKSEKKYAPFDGENYFKFRRNLKEQKGIKDFLGKMFSFKGAMDWFSDNEIEEDEELEKDIQKYQKLIEKGEKHNFELLDKEYSIEETCKAINPNFDRRDEKYSENCTYCAIAYELRRRGLNVVADALGAKSSNLPSADGENGWNRLLEKTSLNQGGNGWFKHSITEQKKDVFEREQQRKQFKDEMIKEMLSHGNGARFQVRWIWSSWGGGHATAAEVHDGKVYFVDPQTNEITENECDYINCCYMPKSSWIRVDNLDIDIDEFIEALVSGGEEND